MIAFSAFLKVFGIILGLNSYFAAIIAQKIFKIAKTKVE